MVKLTKNGILKVLSGIMLMGALSFSAVLCSASNQAIQPGAVANPVDTNRQLMIVPRRWPDRHELVAEISKSYGISYSSLLAFCDGGGALEDACRVAYMAMLANKTFDGVVALKNDANTWLDVFREIGISENVLREHRKQVAVNVIGKRYGLDKKVISLLIDQKYKMADIVQAGRLAKAIKVDVRRILAMKTINNSWKDIEGQLLGDKIDLAQCGSGTPNCL
ncbi:MAG: hypothetical protein K6C05_03065 [Anaerovibrio sp.]|uniref:hypothetical protein n=1 Tax=Anaerovibrio sp. TaxID=1872532 RepID=UPI0025DE4225|nr:hypothetical protein [Anaerovibrio sp.]MCR5175812.1 hypothetical protein [Anaerovibrio sp.]